jgi:hypothetical protein
MKLAMVIIVVAVEDPSTRIAGIEVDIDRRPSRQATGPGVEIRMPRQDELSSCVR